MASGKKCSATLQQLVFLDKLFELYDDDTHDELTLPYSDSAKPFDTVVHELLLQKRQLSDIGGSLLTLIA